MAQKAFAQQGLANVTLDLTTDHRKKDLSRDHHTGKDQTWMFVVKTTLDHIARSKNNLEMDIQYSLSTHHRVRLILPGVGCVVQTTMG